MEKKCVNLQKSSITREFVIIILALIAATILICYFLNTTVIGTYYVTNKQNTLSEGFEVIDEASADGSLFSHEFDITFDNLCANGNITIMIINSDRTIVRSSANDNQTILMEFMNILFGANREGSTILEQTASYNILRQKDARLDAEYLVLYGTLQNGNLILMRSALESIRESAELSSRLLGIAGVSAVVISSTVIYFVFRSIELKNANLALQKDIEEKDKIDEMRKEFLSNVSHELKTPLAVISGYAEGLAECVNEDEESRNYYCEVILDETEKMNQMVKQLLTLNQLEFGQEALQLSRFDITELIHGVLQQVGILLEQKEIAVAFLEEVAYVVGDEYKIETVLMNYLTNAIHHTNEERQIRIFYTRVENRLRVHVFNTGEQIPEHALEEIWTKFYKVDKARTREYGGTGIGLSIVKAIMQSHQQAFGVENQETGVDFWFELDYS